MFFPIDCWWVSTPLPFTPMLVVVVSWENCFLFRPILEVMMDGWGGGSDSGVEWGSGSVFSSVSSRLRVFLGPSGLLVLLNGPSSQTKIHGNHNTDRCLSSGECEFRKALKTNARIRYVEQYPVGIVYWHFVLLPTPRRSRRVRPCQRFTPGVHWPPPFRWIDCLSKRFTSGPPPPPHLRGHRNFFLSKISFRYKVLFS